MSDYNSAYTGEEIDEAVRKVFEAVENGGLSSPSSPSLLTAKVATGNFSIESSGGSPSSNINIGFVPTVIKVYWAPGSNTDKTGAYEPNIGSLASVLCYSGSGLSLTNLIGFNVVGGRLDFDDHKIWMPVGYQGDYIYEAYGTAEPSEGEFNDFESWKNQQMLEFKNWKEQQKSTITDAITELKTWIANQKQTCQDWQNEKEAAFDTWFNNLTESLTVNVNPAASRTYTVETDESGHAELPFTYSDSQAVHVYINGLFATEGEDYTIKSGNIQLTSLDFGSGSDVITFVVFKAGVVSGSGGIVDDEEISVSDIEQMVSKIDGLKD